MRSLPSLFRRARAATTTASNATPIRYHDGTERTWTDALPPTDLAEVERLTEPLPVDATVAFTRTRGYQPRHLAPDTSRARRGPRVQTAGLPTTTQTQES